MADAPLPVLGEPDWHFDKRDGVTTEMLHARRIHKHREALRLDPGISPEAIANLQRAHDNIAALNITLAEIRDIIRDMAVVARPKPVKKPKKQRS
jgi:hypothetical protein